MPEWHFDAGIGEDRAIMVENGEIVEARIERHDGIKPGLVCEAQLIARVVGGTRGILRLDDGSEALLSPVPKGIDEGASLRVEISRSAIDEKSRFKLPMARPAPDQAIAAAPTLFDRLAVPDIATQLYRPTDPADAFEAHGWGEILQQAHSGVVAFDGGSLHIALTPAMTLIDVDGNLPPVELSLKAAAAIVYAIRRLDLQGNIGIDFPALDSKNDRKRVADAFDAAMHGAFERIAINGFGFMQVVTRRERQSLPELLQYRAITAHTLELLRRAQRDRGFGPARIVANPAIIAKLEKRHGWIEALTTSLGRTVTLRADPALLMGGGYCEPAA